MTTDKSRSEDSIESAWADNLVVLLASVDRVIEQTVFYCGALVPEVALNVEFAESRRLPLLEVKPTPRRNDAFADSLHFR